MQGQIIRVKGTFTNANLPKLTDLDTSSILKEILAHPACRSFYDFTDQSKLTLESGKIIKATDLKSVGSFVATSSELAPKFVTTALNGTGGAFFDRNEGMLRNFFSGATNQTVDVGCQVLSLTGTQILLCESDLSQNNLYYNGSQISIAGGSKRINWSGEQRLKINRVTGVYTANLAPKILLNGVAGDITGTTFHKAPDGDATLGRNLLASDANYANIYIGHVAVFDADVSNDSYLNNLLKEYHLRKYKI